MKKLSKIQMNIFLYGSLACMLVVILGKVLSQSEVITSNIGLCAFSVFLGLEDIVISISLVFTFIALLEGYGFLYGSTIPIWMKLSLFFCIITAGSCYLLRNTNVEIDGVNSGEFFATHSIIFLLCSIFFSISIFLIAYEINEYNKD